MSKQPHYSTGDNEVVVPDPNAATEKLSCSGHTAAEMAAMTSEEIEEWDRRVLGGVGQENDHEHDQAGRTPKHSQIPGWGWREPIRRPVM